MALAVLGLAVWWLAHRGDAPATIEPADQARAVAAADRAAAPGLARSLARARRGGGSIDIPEGNVTITGRVIDLGAQAPVGNVEVVFRSEIGEASTTTGSDGRYTIEIAAGVYRAFVRDDSVLTVGRTPWDRLPQLPELVAASVPDESVMTRVLATHNTDGVDLSVVRGGVVAGRVVDPAGHPVAGAVIRAVGNALRPALGTDVAESEPDGSFELRLPSGLFELEVNHPRFAGAVAITGPSTEIDSNHRPLISLSPGAHLSTTLTLAAGCEVRGVVVRPDGRAAGEGAIELRFGARDDDFTPAGHIAADGSFRWVTTQTGTFELRAWPWQSAHSASQSFACADGRRYQGVVFRLLDEPPVLTGVLVDASGAPVANTFLDFDPIGHARANEGQQERTDGNGRWTVHHLPPGAYRISAQAEGLGVAIVQVTAPAQDVRVTLGGTSQIAGVLRGAPASASFTWVPGTCEIEGQRISLPAAQRVVRVVDGRFAIDDLPACTLHYYVLLGDRQYAETTDLSADDTAQVTLDPASEPRQALAQDGLPGEPPLAVGQDDSIDPNDEGAGDEGEADHEASEGDDVGPDAVEDHN